MLFASKIGGFYNRKANQPKAIAGRQAGFLGFGKPKLEFGKRKLGKSMLFLAIEARRGFAYGCRNFLQLGLTQYNNLNQKILFSLGVPIQRPGH